MFRECLTPGIEGLQASILLADSTSMSRKPPLLEAVCPAFITGEEALSSRGL